MTEPARPIHLVKIAGLGAVVAALGGLALRLQMPPMAVVPATLFVAALFGYVGLAANTKRNRQVEATLRYSEDLAKTLLNTSGDATFLIDCEGTILAANQTLASRFGRTAEDIVGLKIFDLIPPHLAEARRAQCRQVIEQGTPVHMQDERNGLVLENRLYPVRDARGNIIQIAFFSRDVTEQRRAEQRLKESEERFRTLVETTTDWVWETDDNHRLCWLSSTFETTMEIASEPRMGKERWINAMENGKMNRAHWRAHFDDLAARRSFRDFRYWTKTDTGGAKWLSVSGAPRFDEAGTFLGYRGIGSDITARAAQSFRLRMLSAVVDQSPVSVLVTDPDGIITYVNPRFSAATGYSAAEMIGQTARIFSAAETESGAHQEIWMTIRSGKSWTGEFKNQKKDKTDYWERATIFPVTTEEGEIANVVAITEDITYRKTAESRLAAQQAELERLARTDPLTGLANRRVFVDTVRAEFERCKRFGSTAALLMIDVDYFKQVNDLRGHEAGDEALIALAALLAQTVRTTDLAARFGGEEFTILLTGTDLAGAVEMAERIRGRASEIVVSSAWGPFSITVSIGASVFDLSDGDWSVALRRADEALYLAKTQGRNRVTALSPQQDSEPVHP